MAHRFAVREIARQAGLSEATVDRVLHERGGVRPSTKELVNVAIEELSRQVRPLRPGEHSLVIDLVMWTPLRFSAVVQHSLERSLVERTPHAIRVRSRCLEHWTLPALVAWLDRLPKRKSQGVILKAPDLPQISAAIERLSAAGIPVVTLVTDITDSSRLAYVGSDNESAGETAAHLVHGWMQGVKGKVAVVTSGEWFNGEEQRANAFCSQLACLTPQREVTTLECPNGLDAETYQRFSALLDADSDINAVYSVGGGNAGILSAFDYKRKACACFITHDLGEEHRALLSQRRLSAVLHHDLVEDMRRACNILLHYHYSDRRRGDAQALAGGASPIQVITPYNLPR